MTKRKTDIEKEADQIGKFLVKARKDPGYKEKVKAVEALDKSRRELKSVERVVKPLFRSGNMPCIMLGPECEHWVGKKVVVRLVEE